MVAGQPVALSCLGFQVARMMNQLLKSLEGLGYIARRSDPDEGRARIVRFTRRGHAAYAKIYEILLEIEHEWRAELGARCFDEFKRTLSRIWDSPLVRG